MSIHIAIDIGGTFTDVIVQEENGVKATKVSTTPENLVQGVQHGIEEIIEKTSGTREDVSRFAHGTTAGTNAIIEQTGGTVGLLMTEGFRDTLAIGRQKRSEMYDLFIDEQTPTFLAPRDRRLEVAERVDENGDVLRPLDEDQVIDAVDTLVEEHDVESIGICYLFSFLNSEHEIRSEEIINERYPSVHVSRSSNINPKFREYERLVVTAFDAYLRPVINEYVSDMRDTLDEESIDCELQIMQSRGGITNSDLITEQPVRTVLSGPAAAVAGAADIGSRANFEDLITLDMGGTSSDVSLIQDGNPRISSEGELIDYPLRMQLVDINTIGSGGGSIAWLDEADSLHVGPESAGADPGPACYDNGGTRPTVTDASLVLGYLNPDYFADGAFDLSIEKAKKAIRTDVAEPLGYDLIEAAKGIHNIVNTQMAEQLRLITVERGFDPREFGLCAMGGAGPVHAGWLANELQIPTVVIPRKPGVLSAQGLLAANIEHDHETTLGEPLTELDPESLEDAYQDLIERGDHAMRREDVSLEDVVVTRQVDMQYSGQSFEIDIDVPFNPITQDAMDQLRERFHKRHAHVYGHKNEDDPVEVINVRAIHTFTPDRIEIPRESKGNTLEEARKGSREMHFASHEGSFSVPIYQRSKLPLDETFDGPAVIEQSDTTTVLYPEQRSSIDEQGNLLIST